MRLLARENEERTADVGCKKWSPLIEEYRYATGAYLVVSGMSQRSARGLNEATCND